MLESPDRAVALRSIAQPLAVGAGPGHGRPAQGHPDRPGDQADPGWLTDCGSDAGPGALRRAGLTASPRRMKSCPRTMFPRRCRGRNLDAHPMPEWHRRLVMSSTSASPPLWPPAQAESGHLRANEQPDCGLDLGA
jgi:hypothetical protein